MVGLNLVQSKTVENWIEFNIGKCFRIDKRMIKIENREIQAQIRNNLSKFHEDLDPKFHFLAILSFSRQGFDYIVREIEF